LFFRRELAPMVEEAVLILRGGAACKESDLYEWKNAEC